MTPRRVSRLVDVADRAGVTVSTASRALARPELVRAETRERVEQAARELGYAPNRAARSLITGRTGSIAVVLPDLTNTYFTIIARAAQAFARERGYEVFIIDTSDDASLEDEVVASMARWADGVVICAAKHAHHPNSDVPIVYVNRRVRGSHAVLLDQHFIVEAQLGHLLALGHEHIVWMSGPKDYWASHVRERHVLRIAAAHPGIRIAPPLTADFGGGAEMVDLLEPGDTAVVGFNDRQAIGFISRCAEVGIDVPKEISVVGSDDIPGTDFVQPALTTVRAPKELLGRAAVSLLIDHLTTEGPVIVETVRGELIVRASAVAPHTLEESER